MREHNDKQNSKYMEKGASAIRTLLNANKNHSHLDLVRVNPMTVCMASTVRIDSSRNP
jgi:hypothetical protein